MLFAHEWYDLHTKVVRFVNEQKGELRLTCTETVELMAANGCEMANRFIRTYIMRSLLR